MSSLSGEAWTPYFFKRVDAGNDPIAPALDYLESVPTEVEAELMATVDAVAASPPPKFRGGLRYQAMHGEMTRLA